MGEIFRLVNGDPPTAYDFLSYFELGKQLTTSEKLCQFCGLSVYLSEDAVKDVRSKVPGMRRMKIAKGRLSPEWGKLVNTPGKVSTAHHTWWLPKGKSNVERLFAVVVL
jgi:hypothetical protein